MKIPIQYVFFLAIITLATNGVCHLANQGLTEPTAIISSANANQRRMVERWTISKPTLKFNRDESLLVLNYGTSENENKASENKEDPAILSSVSLWTKECRSGGGTEIKTKGGDKSAMIMENNSDVSVAIDLGELWSDSRGKVADATSSESTSISFCVRYALGIKATTTSGEETTFEVNFVESVVTATAATTVDEQQQVTGITTANIRDQKVFDNDFTIEGFVCNKGGGFNSTTITCNSRHTVNLSQGSVIGMCVQPSRGDRSIQITSIEEFTWHKIGLDYGSVLVSQEAVKNGVASDFLTLYNGCRNDQDDYCSLETLLLGDFYLPERGVIGGTGTVSLKFRKPRKRIYTVESVQVRPKDQQMNATQGQMT